MLPGLREKLKNVTTAKKIVDSILQAYKPFDKVEDVDILHLLQYHPTKHIVPENIEYLIRKPRPPYNTLALYYKYKGSPVEDDISYVMCIKNLFGKYSRDKSYEEDVRSAFRNEAHLGRKKQFFLENTTHDFQGVCAHCKITTNRIAVDHYKLPFKQILEDFLQSENLPLTQIEVFETSSNEMRLKDEGLAKTWLNYHDSHAVFRLLCKSCNSHFGAYDKDLA